jgi:hypothetical protein
VRCKASRYFRNKKKEYLEDKIKELATISKNKNIRDLMEEYINLRGATNRQVTS